MPFDRLYIMDSLSLILQISQIISLSISGELAIASFIDIQQTVKKDELSEEDKERKSLSVDKGQEICLTLYLEWLTYW